MTLRHVDKAEMKEAKERHWNHTVSKIVAAETKVANKVEYILNKTAAKVFETKAKIDAVKEDVKGKLAAKMVEASNKWSEMKNKAAEGVAAAKAKVDAAKDKLQAKVSAVIHKVGEKANELIQFKQATVAKGIEKVHQVKSGSQPKQVQKLKSTVDPAKRVTEATVEIVNLPETSFVLSTETNSVSSFSPLLSY